MENALRLRDEVGPEGKKEWKDRYTLDQLLDNKFHLPDPYRPKVITSQFMREEDLPPFQGGLAQILALSAENVQGVKTWKYVPPETNGNGEEI